MAGNYEKRKLNEIFTRIQSLSNDVVKLNSEIERLKETWIAMEYGVGSANEITQDDINSTNWKNLPIASLTNSMSSFYGLIAWLATGHLQNFIKMK